jgi:PmbA protein
MNDINQLERNLYEYMISGKKDLQVKGWYFGINKRVSITTGIKDSQLGGVYSCPKAQEDTRGKLYIIWKDNRRTIAAIDSTTLEDYSKWIEIWRKTSFKDEEGPFIYKSSHYPQVKLFDHQVNQLVYKDKTWAVELLEQYACLLKKANINNIDASITASVHEHHIRNSIGLEISTMATSFSTYLFGDKIHGKSYSSRRIIDSKEIHNLIETTISRVQKLKNRSVIGHEEMDVLIIPEVTESFINHFLISNLNGNRVINKRAAFTQEDFLNHKKAFRKDLSLSLDTTIDYNSGSYISTFEGVPGGTRNLIENGRLMTPILDLKYAQKMSCPPTPIPMGRGSINITSENIQDETKLISKIDKGIIIYDLLGMHTQDSGSGNYSLTAPNSIFIEKGVLKEACKTVITGNFLEALKREDTYFGSAAFENNPLIVMKAFVKGEK